MIEYAVIDASGDELGILEVHEDAPDDVILETLVRSDYLEPPAGEYSIDDAYSFSAEGERTVVDGEGEAVLTLLGMDPGDEDDDDDADEDDDDDLNLEDVL
jgi:hypothetical protein